MRLDRTHSLSLSLLAALALAASTTACGDGTTAATDTSTPGDATSTGTDAVTDPDGAATDATVGDSSVGPTDATTGDSTTPGDTSTSTDAAIDPDILAGNSIIGVLSRAGHFQTLLAAIQRRNLVSDLATGDYTVLAPTDDAFEAYRTAAGLTAEQLLASPQLDNLVRYHVIAGKLDAAALGAQYKRATLIDVAIYFEASDGLKLNVIDQVPTASVVTADTAADNGFVHTIDAVLVPPKLALAARLEHLGAFSVTLAAADLDGLDDDDTQHTAFAPDDNAFFDLLRARGQTSEQFLADPQMPDIMRYRVVVGRYLAADLAALDGTTLPSMLRLQPAAGAPYFSALTIVKNGDTLSINNHPVVGADIRAVNGILHIVGAGISLPVDLKTQMQGTSMDTFLGVLDAQGLGGKVVAPEGPVTVFGPINQAFGDISPEDTDGAFHIVPGVLLPADIAKAASTGLETLDGKTLPVSVGSDGQITIGGSHKALVDPGFIPASNGILYVLGNVAAP